MGNDVVEEIIAGLPHVKLEVLPDTPLIGDGKVLDSMGLVELCLRLEDRAMRLGFAFDWTSETAMSKSRSMFRTVGALQEEFDRQKTENQ